MAETDRTVQVPVSLIRKVRAALHVEPLAWNTRQDIYRSLDALLSQPPMSLPTREQIAKAAYYAEKRADYGDSWTERWEDESEGYQATYLTIADAVLALFSQPTPTAEPRTCEWCGQAATGDALCDGEANNSCGAEGHGHDFASWTAEPPRMTTDEDVAEAQALLDQVVRESGVESTAPGTTFIARHADQWKRFEYAGSGRIRFVGGNGTSFLLNGPHGPRIDPSTIRDVQPPTS